MRKIITRLIDDLDGSEAAETVVFNLDGVNFEIDLSEVNAKQLREVFAPYVEAGRRQTGTVGRPTAARVLSRAENAKIRRWALDNGRSVAERGRIPQGVIDAYRAAA